MSFDSKAVYFNRKKIGKKTLNNLKYLRRDSTNNKVNERIWNNLDVKVKQFVLE